MPEDGSRLCNVAVLADEGRRVELAIALQKFERVAPLLTSREGLVMGSVALERIQGRVEAEVAVQAEVVLRCQRCLEPMRLAVESHSRVALVESEAAAAAVPPEMETALAPDGRMRLADLVEEELLLALPAAPRHEECAGGIEANEDSAEPTQRPFAALGELLKSNRSKQ